MEVYNVTIFGLHLKINPVAFTLPIGGGWEVHWYGIIIALGFVLALLYAYKYSKMYNIDLDRAIDVVIVTVPVAILCARAYYLIFSGENFGFNDFLPINGGFSGLAIYGGVIGAFVCGAAMCYFKKIRILDMFDLASMGFLIGQAVGRWGNFTNQEAFGGPTGSSFFGMWSENVRDDYLIKNGYDPNALVHPCFLYESLWCIIGFFVIHNLSKKRKFSGETTLMYGVWYGIGRAIIESFRTDSLMLGNLRVSQLLSIILCIACSTLLVTIRIRIKRTAHDSEYVAIIPDEEEINSDETLEEMPVEEETDEQTIEKEGNENE